MPQIGKLPPWSECPCGRVGHLARIGQCAVCARAANDNVANAAYQKARYWRQKNAKIGYRNCSGAPFTGEKCSP